ncbi:NADPH-dependent FMN reductase [Phocaeicola vulgatus]|uniref:flavodoxin family protein n=1 Tax=Phocaeicola vulgatus TaxID=821 RepID=UPI002090B493|nr:flavodoxin family protein [Phocaeicola vulgatus]MCO5803971.1 NADPH-dependent FMN reductase [Phocaeicola vulgatus]
MKVLLVNGSPHQKGETYNALSLVEKALHEKGIATEWFWVRNKPVRGCIDCGQCSKTFRCAFSDDVCNDLIEAILNADGIIIGSPVYFAAPNGALCALLDRVFYAASTHGGLFKGKPAAAVASCIRSGANSTVDRINKYFSFSEMPIVSSSYWNMLFDSHSSIGFDERGHKTMQTLGYNMASILQKIS